MSPPYPARIPDTFMPICRVDTLTASEGAIFIQPDGPGTPMLFLGCHQIEGIDEPLGDYTVAYCADVSKNKKWITVSEVVSPSGVINLSISEDVTSALSYLTEVICPFPLYVVFSNSGRRDIFENGIVTFIVNVKKVTNRTIDNVVLIESDERIMQTLSLASVPPIIETRDIVTSNVYIGGNTPINDIVFY